MKQAPFKMKGFSGFGNSPAKQILKPDPPREQPKKQKPKRTNFNVSNPPPKPNRKDNLRAISGFEADFPKVKRGLKSIVDMYNPVNQYRTLKKGAREVSKKVKQGIDYFRAK
jgi:hypothetical protein